MCSEMMLTIMAIIENYSYIVKNKYKKSMSAIENISIGTIIEMVRTGKRFVVDSISPQGIVLKECSRLVTFSRSALNERFKRKSAVIIEY